MWNFGKKKDLSVLIAEGQEFLNSGQDDKAAAKFQEVVKLDPTHAEAWYCLGTIHGGSGRFEEAVECYRKSAQNAPPERQPLPLYNMGNSLQEMGRDDQALETFQLVTSIDPEFADAWINQGRLLDDSGKHAEAVDCYDKALALAPEDSIALSNRGNSLRSLHRIAEAKASYEAALQVDPDDPAGLSGLGLCLAEMGRLEEGLALLDQALNLGMFLPWLVERATILSQLDRDDEAIESIEEARRQGLDGPEVLNNLGEILAKVGRVEEAIASFDEALKQNPSFPPALFGKARVLCNSGQFGPAKATIDLYFQHSDGTDGLDEGAQALVALCRDAGVE